MNTTQMSELYTLHNMVNDPQPNYRAAAEARSTPQSRLLTVLARFVFAAFRKRSARVSEMIAATGSIDSI